MDITNTIGIEQVTNNMIKRKKHPNNKEMVGKKYGRLTLRSYLGIKVYGNNSQHRGSVFRCDCECGNTKDVSRKYLLSGSVESCGCLRNPAEDADEKTAKNRAKYLRNRAQSELKAISRLGYTSESKRANFFKDIDFLSRVPDADIKFQEFIGHLQESEKDTEDQLNVE